MGDKLGSGLGFKEACWFEENGGDGLSSVWKDGWGGEFDESRLKISVVLVRSGWWGKGRSKVGLGFVGTVCWVVGRTVCLGDLSFGVWGEVGLGAWKR